MKKNIYLSGVHSSGKTTLLKNIQYSCPEVRCLERFQLEIPTNISAFERASLRLMKYFLEAKQHKKKAEENGKAILVGDRCIYDTLVYVNAYFMLDWISKKDKECIYYSYKRLFKKELLPQKIIYLAPPYDWVIDKLHKRWKENYRKEWRESNFEYLKSVIDSYEEFFNNSLNKLLIENVVIERISITDLDQRSIIAKGFIEELG